MQGNTLKVAMIWCLKEVYRRIEYSIEIKIAKTIKQTNREKKKQPRG